MNEQSIIEVINVSKSFKYDTIIKNLSFSFYGGNIYGLVGSNGSGKTVFMKILSGFLKPTSGVVKYNGQELYSQIEFPSSMGILIENPAMLDYLTGFENLKMLASINKSVDDDEIKKLMRMLDLDPDSKKTVEKYSLGMKQKIGIIQAIMEKPQVIILDEPTNSLDKKSIKILIDYFKLLKSNNSIIIISSHQSREIATLCDEVIQFPFLGNDDDENS